MITISETAAIEQRTRAIAQRTFGERHGPITGLIGPSRLGRRLKPSAFLDS